MNQRALLFSVMSLSGCIFYADESPFEKDEARFDEASLYVEPEQVSDPGTYTFTVMDESWPSVDFRDVYDVRSLGEFEIIEWSPTETELSLVIEVLDGADGEQPIALDTASGTAYASFEAY